MANEHTPKGFSSPGAFENWKASMRASDEMLRIAGEPLSTPIRPGKDLPHILFTSPDSLEHLYRRADRANVRRIAAYLDEHGASTYATGAAVIDHLYDRQHEYGEILLVGAASTKTIRTLEQELQSTEETALDTPQLKYRVAKQERPRPNLGITTSKHYRITRLNQGKHPCAPITLGLLDERQRLWNQIRPRT